MAGTYYKVCVACVSIFYAIRVEDLAAERVAAEASIIGFVEAQRAEGLLAPFLVVQDFIVDRLQIIASEGLPPERAEELTAWAVSKGLPGLVGITEAAYRTEAPYECRARN